ncbi:MAG: Ig-like domain-containing protein [Clostridia bacterium]|nr:Ig-like domain-containing protein [Clostridia bacterium]
MKYRWILWALTLVLALTVASGAAVAEHFDAAPTIDVTLGRGESFTLDTTGLLVAEGQTLKFKTSDGKVAAVSADGVITALKKGKATIAVGYDKTLLGLCKVTVVKAPRKVVLSEKKALLSTGGTLELSAKLSRGTASALTYTSSNEAIATVDATGKVTGVSGGKATITVKTFNDRSAECVIYVLGGKAPATLSLNASSVNLQVGETFKLIPGVDEGSDAFYKYVAQDKKIAKVNSEGEITGIRPGITSVAVLTHNGLTQTVGVNVKPRLKEVYGSLTNEPAKFLKAAKKLKLTRDAAAGSGSVVCRDDELSLAMTADSCTVTLNAVQAPRYCIQGVDVSMTPEAAAAKLIAAGWALTGSRASDGIEHRAFTKDSDTTHFITVSTANGTTVSSLSAQWHW